MRRTAFGESLRLHQSSAASGWPMGDFTARYPWLRFAVACPPRPSEFHQCVVDSCISRPDTSLVRASLWSVSFLPCGESIRESSKRLCL